MKKFLVLCLYMIIIIVGNLGLEMWFKPGLFDISHLIGFILSLIIWIPAYCTIDNWLDDMFDLD